MKGERVDQAGLGNDPEKGNTGVRKSSMGTWRAVAEELTGL